MAARGLAEISFYKEFGNSKDCAPSIFSLLPLHDHFQICSGSFSQQTRLDIYDDMNVRTNVVHKKSVLIEKA